MQQANPFADIETAARRAMEIANERAARELTGELHRHLMDAGMSATAAHACRIEHNDEANRFDMVVGEEAERHSYGDGDSPGSGAVTTFWNHVDAVKIHNRHLYRSSREVGIF